MSVHTLTLGDLLREHRRSRPGVTAAVDGDLRLTYPELDDRVNRLASALRADGVGPGDRVLYAARTSHRFQEGLLAASKTGAVFVAANWRQSGAELEFVLDDVAPRVVLWEDAEPVGAAVAHARGRAGGGARWVGDADYEAYLSAADPADPGDPVPGDAPVLGLYTAAFDGRPACALLSSDALLSHSAALLQARQITPGFTFLNSGPLFHVGTLMFHLATFHAGGTNVFMPAFDAAGAARLVAAERVDHMFGFGPMLSGMVEANRGESGKPRHDLSSLRSVAHSPDWDAWTTVGTDPWNASGMGGYGQTEVGGMLTLLALGPGGAGSAGRPSPMVQVRLLDPEGHEVPDGEVGEFAARGRTVFSGYLGRPELNERKAAGGWHHTGDLGRREADGTLTFIGPRLRLIKSGHENIYPAEVERVLTSHPEIVDAAVIGVPDPAWAQSVKAVVVRAVGSVLTEEQVVAHVRASIASYKKPRSVVFTDAIPKNGHLPDYAALDEAHGGGGYPGE